MTKKAIAKIAKEKNPILAKRPLGVEPYWASSFTVDKDSLFTIPIPHSDVIALLERGRISIDHGEKVNILGFATGIPLLGVGFLLISGLSDLLWIPTALGVTSIAAVGAGFIRNRYDRDALELVYMTLENLVEWASQRYNVELDPTASEIFSLLWADESITVVDIKGKEYILHRYENGSYGLTSKKTKIAVKKSASKEFDMEDKLKINSLQHDSKRLAQNILDNIHLLDTRELNIERTHAVKRVTNDLKQLVQFNKNLRSLGRVAQEEDNVAILSALNEELKLIIDSEANDINSQIRVQKSYVKDRKFFATESTLNLALTPKAKPENALTLAEERGTYVE